MHTPAAEYRSAALQDTRVLILNVRVMYAAEVTDVLFRDHEMRVDNAIERDAPRRVIGTIVHEHSIKLLVTRKDAEIGDEPVFGERGDRILDLGSKAQVSLAMPNARFRIARIPQHMLENVLKRLDCVNISAGRLHIELESEVVDLGHFLDEAAA